MNGSVVARPGRQPQPSVFPHAQGQRLQEAAQQLSDEIGVLVEQARCPLAHAHMGFQGRVRVDEDLTDLVTALDVLRRRLAEQAGQVAIASARARQASDDREAERAAWRRDLAAWQDAQRAAS